MTEPTPLNVIDLMRVVMDADIETRGFALRGTTNWAAHIGKAVQNAVLYKFGTPPVVAGEPVAFLVCNEEGDPDMVFLNRHEAQQYLEDHERPIPLYTTPQPTQAQAEAITPPPIECDTEELKRAYAFGWWSALEKQRETAQAAAVPLTDREIELIDGMIQVQLDHASRCDAIANRSMADKQKGWDMERVALLQKIKAHGIKGGQHGL